MSWSELVGRVAERAGVTPQVARKVLGALTEEVAAALAADGEVRIPALGTLRRVYRPARALRSVSDQRRMWLGATHDVRFRPAAGVLRQVRAADDEAWRSPEYQDAWRLAETLLDDLELYHAARRPMDVLPDDPDPHVHDACERAFGPLWDRGRRTWTDRTPWAVRQQSDLLALAARARWAALAHAES